MNRITRVACALLIVLSAYTPSSCRAKEVSSAAPALPPAAASGSVEAEPPPELFAVVMAPQDESRSVVIREAAGPCALLGKAFLCGAAEVLVVDADAVRRDTALEAGLPHAPGGLLVSPVTRMLGRWPTDAWLQMSIESNGRGLAAFYHWQGESWIKAAAFSHVSWHQEPLAYAGGLEVALSEMHCCDDEWITHHYFGPDGGTLPSPEVPWQPVSEPWTSTALADDGTLFLAHEASVGRWTRSDAGDLVTENLHMPAGKIRTIHGLTALKGGGLAVFGPAPGPGSAVLVYDGAAWSEGTLPPYVDEVRSYVRAGDGTTWALVVRLGDKGVHLWSERPGRGWAEVPVHGLGEHVLLWRLGILNGELWLVVFAGEDTVLLRPRPLVAPVTLPL